MAAERAVISAAHASFIIREIFEDTLFPPTSEVHSWLAEDEANTREILAQCGAAVHQLHRRVGRRGAVVDGEMPGHAGANVMGLLVAMDWGPPEERRNAQQALQSFLRSVGRGGATRAQMVEVPCILPRLAELGEGWAATEVASQ